jgi:hypothetical protein
MGYDVHITRAAAWAESESLPISIKEWLEYVERDPEMRLDNIARVSTRDGTVVSYENPGLSVWTAYSGHERAGSMAWFDYRNGRIVVKNPDKEILTKMKRIAEQFGATVVGDEGERY